MWILLLITIGEGFHLYFNCGLNFLSCLCYVWGLTYQTSYFGGFTGIGLKGEICPSHFWKTASRSILLNSAHSTPTLQVQSGAFLRSNHKFRKWARLDSDICQMLITTDYNETGFGEGHYSTEKTITVCFTVPSRFNSTIQHKASSYTCLYVWCPQDYDMVFSVQYYFMHVLKWFHLRSGIFCKKNNVV